MLNKSFDWEWYNTQYSYNFMSELEALEDCARKSVFADVLPFPNFSTRKYLSQNPKIYLSNQSHFAALGDLQPNTYPGELWSPSHTIKRTEWVKEYDKKKITIIIHIYYKEFVRKFKKSLTGLPFNIDLFITTPFDEVVQECNKIFNNSLNIRIRNFGVKLCPNRGRNIAPLLIEWKNEIKQADVVLHMHSKKSLYSGKENNHWFEYLSEYLIRDKVVLVNALSLLFKHEKIGLYYPVTFWNMPPWVNHWLRNKSKASELAIRMGLPIRNSEFISYPVGGMFWFKPQALAKLFDLNLRYEDFPEEPIPNDGTIAHAIERLLEDTSITAGFKTLIYHDRSGSFTFDSNYIYSKYLEASNNPIDEIFFTQYQVVSFDLFDTLIIRSRFEPDFAKVMVNRKLKICANDLTFVKLRNETELNIRRSRKFAGDVSINEIYMELSKTHLLGLDHELCAQIEFQFDLDEIRMRAGALSLLNKLKHSGKKIVIATDTYYRKDQILHLLKSLQIPFDDVFVSSDLNARKDTGEMWKIIREKYTATLNSFIHVGDNVISDAQNPGDYGIRTHHILGPHAKLHFKKIPYVYDDAGTAAELFGSLNCYINENFAPPFRMHYYNE